MPLSPSRAIYIETNAYLGLLLFMATWMIFRLDQTSLVIKSIKAPCAYLVKCAQNSTYCPDLRGIYAKCLSFSGNLCPFFLHVGTERFSELICSKLYC